MNDDSESNPAASDAPQYACPSCGAANWPSDPEQRVLQCTDCGEQSFLPGDEQDAEAARAAEAEALARGEAEAARELDLSEMRIRQIANLRRGAYRSRSWLIVGIVACIVGAAQLVFLAIQGRRHGLRIAPAFDGITAVAALMICAYFIRRVRELSREIRESKQQDPPEPPDLSTLSDGSQQLGNLERLANQSEEP